MKKIKDKYKNLSDKEKNKLVSILRNDVKTTLLAQINSLEFILNKIEENQTKELLKENLNSNYFLLNLIENALILLNFEENYNSFNQENSDFSKEFKICYKEIDENLKNKNQKLVIKKFDEINLKTNKKVTNNLIKNIISTSIMSSFENSDIEIYLEEDKDFVSFITKNKSAYMTKEKIKNLNIENKTNSNDFNQLGMSLNYSIIEKLIEKQKWDIIINSYKDNSLELGFKIKK